jgi:NAD(P)-dependent dehydrogenase (short-subunit alcohol dehydrogenase family)
VTDETPLKVLITGAAQGLGAALADAYEERGHSVMRTDREYADGVFKLDVTSDEDWAGIRELVEETWGRLDVLVNNAGIAGGGRLDVSGMDEWQRLIDINLLGVVRGTATFTPMFKAQQGGRIVNIASLAGLVHPAGMAGYNATKAAVVALTETTGHELAAYGVTAHAVCPSYFRTALIEGAQGRDTALVATIGRLVENAPRGPEEVAAEILRRIDRGDELVVPDPEARAAYDLKRSDRATYDQVMRAQAKRLAEAGEAAE